LTEEERQKKTVEQEVGVLWSGNRLNFACVPLCRFRFRAYHL